MAIPDLPTTHLSEVPASSIDDVNRRFAELEGRIEAMNDKFEGVESTLETLKGRTGAMNVKFELVELTLQTLCEWNKTTGKFLEKMGSMLCTFFSLFSPVQRSRVELPCNGLKVVVEDHPPYRLLHNLFPRWPNFAEVIEPLFGNQSLNFGDYVSYRLAFRFSDISSSVFRGSITVPCTLALCPYASSYIKFVSECDGFTTVAGFLEFESPGVTLFGMDGKFFALLRRTDRVNSINVYNWEMDTSDNVLIPLSSKGRHLDIRIGFLVHEQDSRHHHYFIVCICVLRDKSRGFFYASTDSSEGWTEVTNLVIPRHLNDYVAARSKYEMFWVNFDKESAYMSVLVFDIFTEAFREINVINVCLESCKSASIISMGPCNITTDIWLCLIMEDGKLGFCSYEQQEDESHFFVLKFTVFGPSPTPDRVLFSLGAGVLLCTNQASVWKLDFGKSKVKRISAVPQHIEEFAPIYHTMFAVKPKDLLVSLKKWKMRQELSITSRK